MKKHTGSGWVDKQNEAVEICKQCKYRKQYIEQRNKTNKYDSLVEKIKENLRNKEIIKECETISDREHLNGEIFALQELLDTVKE